MAEVLLSFDTPVRDASGEYRARAIGRAAPDGMWEAWLEFIALDGGGSVLVTSVESRQPEHGHLVYWATGLAPVYLEGALARARRPAVVRAHPVEVPISEAPAP